MVKNEESSAVKVVMEAAIAKGKGYRETLVGRQGENVHWCWADGEFAQGVKDNDDEVWHIDIEGNITQIIGTLPRGDWYPPQNIGESDLRTHE